MVKMRKVKKIPFYLEYSLDSEWIFLPTGDTLLIQNKLSDLS